MDRKKLFNYVLIGLIILVFVATAVIVTVVIVARPELKIAVISDIHYLDDDQYDLNSKAFIDYNNTAQKMLDISPAIFRSVTDNIIDMNVDVVLVSGDLTEDGSEISHLSVAENLKRIEDSGKKVFVINGNHDVDISSNSYKGDAPTSIQNVSSERFAEIYNDFGYGEAISRCSENLSYSADIGENYRLIALDPSTYTSSNGKEYASMGSFSEGTLLWIKEQCEKAAADNKKIIGMTHIPLLDHMLPIDSSAFKVENSAKIADDFLDWGFEYFFVGHLHQQNISSYEREDGKTLYEIQTGSLVSYPIPIREVKLYPSSVSIKSNNVKSLNKSYAKDDLSKDILNSFNNIQKYAKSYIKTDIENMLLTILDNGYNYRGILSSVLSDIGINETFNDKEKFEQVISILKTALVDFMNMPLYDESNSLENLCDSYGINLPSIKYDTVMDFACDILAGTFAGDENIEVGSKKAEVLKYCIYAFVYKLQEHQVFSKLNALYDFVPNIDFSTTMEKLFKYGELEVVQSNIINEVIALIPQLKDVYISPSGGLNVLRPLLSGFSDIEILGIKILGFINYENNSIMVGDLLDQGVLPILLRDVLNDREPSDNSFSFKVEKLDK